MENGKHFHRWSDDVKQLKFLLLKLFYIVSYQSVQTTNIFRWNVSFLKTKSYENCEMYVMVNVL